MSKKDTSYADAMNQWAAKQSFIRNRKNRILHPNPELPALLQALGYLFRVVVVLFVLWLIGNKLSGKYFNGPAFNEKLTTELTTLLDAEDLENSSLYWSGSKAQCKKITASGSESAFYRNLEATSLSFKLPLLQRLRPGWTIDQLRIEDLSIELKSGGKSENRVGATAPQPLELMTAGLLPSPDLSELKINRLSCGKSDISWGLTRSTLGALSGAKFDLTNLAGDWRLDLRNGIMRQNWLRDLHVDSITVRREGKKLTLADSEVWLGDPESAGTLEGSVTLDRLPRVELDLRLPKVSTRALLAQKVDFPEYFFGDLDLDLDISGSINTMSGIQTSGTAKLIRGTFSKIPAFDAVDQMLKMSLFRVFSPAEGTVEFSTGSGKLEVTKLKCQSAGGTSVIRGSFTYTRGISTREAEAANSTSLVSKLAPKLDSIEGNLKLGIRPNRIEGNELAQRYFKESAEGYVWVDIPLSGPLDQVTKALATEILTATHAVKP